MNNNELKLNKNMLRGGGGKMKNLNKNLFGNTN